MSCYAYKTNHFDYYIEKMGENSRMLYEKDFEIQKMVSKTNNVYKELMG